MGKMVEAAMDNLQVEVRNIHLRYEDNETVPGVCNILYICTGMMVMYRLVSLSVSL